MNWTRRLACLLAVALVGAGCGAGQAGVTGGDDPDGGDGPITIDHTAGTTTLEEVPERIVSLSVQWTDALLALDVVPAAYVLDRAALEEEPYPWHVDALGESVRIDASGELPFEQIAAQEPDLVLAAWSGADPEVFSQLEGIAPTIGLLGDRDVDRWQDQVEVLGQVLARADDAEATIAEVEGAIDAVADDLPGLDGMTYAMVLYSSDFGFNVVADPDDGAAELFDRLGMRIAPTILDAADEGGRLPVSVEQVEMLDADVIILYNQSGEVSEVPGWAGLPAVQNDTLVELTFEDVVGLNTPTPWSITYALDLIRPTLEVAADG